MSQTNSVSGIYVGRTILKSVKFTVISYIMSIILLAVVAVIVVYTDVSEKISVPSVRVITLLGAFISALLTSKNSSSKGWLCGILTGAFNVAVLMSIGAFLTDASLFTKSNLILVSLGGMCGMIGGIIGVNLGDNQ